MTKFNVYNLTKWVEDNRHLLKPPVGNKEIFPNEDFMVMVIGGPNERVDYHYNEGPEFFFQIEGDITVKIMNDGKFEDIEIKEGEVFVLPPKVPHSPQRPAGTIGLVIEERRKDYQTDGFQWYCPNCGNKLYDEYFKLTNVEKQLPAVFKKFNSNTDLHTCKNCGTVLEVPQNKV